MCSSPKCNLTFELSNPKHLRNWHNIFNGRLSISLTAMAFVVGTFIQVRMVLFLRSSKIRKTDIDEMILLEQESVQQSRLSSQFAYQCCNLPQLSNTPKNVPFHLNLHCNLNFDVFKMGFKRRLTILLILAPM